MLYLFQTDLEKVTTLAIFTTYLLNIQKNAAKEDRNRLYFIIENSFEGEEIFEIRLKNIYEYLTGSFAGPLFV